MYINMQCFLLTLIHPLNKRGRSMRIEQLLRYDPSHLKPEWQKGHHVTVKGQGHDPISLRPIILKTAPDRDSVTMEHL